MYKRMLGIFIPRHHYQSIKNENSLPSSYAQFESAAESYHLSVCFLSSNFDLNDNEITVLVRDTKKNKFVEIKTNIPLVIYNRSSLNNKKVRKALHHFIQIGSKVFNYIPTKNSKYYVHQLLEREDHLKQFLPTTLKGTSKNLEYALHHMENFFIKPCYSSLGKGIMNVKKEIGGTWYLNKKEFNLYEIKKVKKLFKHRSYLIQERIPLATFQNRPFDIRIIVQKDGTGNWKISGMVAKLAPEGYIITNVGRGGEIGVLQEYFIKDEKLIQETIKKINQLSIDIAKVLEKKWPHISDLGLDIGITDNGSPYFIECNLRGQYGALRKNKDHLSLWKKIHDTPIAYAKYLFHQHE